VTSCTRVLFLAVHRERSLICCHASSSFALNIAPIAACSCQQRLTYCLCLGKAGPRCIQTDCGSVLSSDTLVGTAFQAIGEARHGLTEDVQEAVYDGFSILYQCGSVTMLS